MNLLGQIVLWSWEIREGKDRLQPNRGSLTLTWEVHQVHRSPTKSYRRAPGKIHESWCYRYKGFGGFHSFKWCTLDRSFYDFSVIQASKMKFFDQLALGWIFQQIGNSTEANRPFSTFSLPSLPPWTWENQKMKSKHLTWRTPEPSERILDKNAEWNQQEKVP